MFQSWRKPFNPILGETWEATLDDGATVFLEQISHHPPVSAFQMIGPGARFSPQMFPVVHEFLESTVQTDQGSLKSCSGLFCTNALFPFDVHVDVCRELL